MPFSQLKEISLICPICGLIYERPVKLPCGACICESHLYGKSKLARILKSAYTCRICPLIHQIPPQGFELHAQIQQRVNSRSHMTESESQIGEELDQSLRQLDIVYDRLDEAANYVAAHFEELRTQIVAYRDQLKSKFDSLAQNMLDKVSRLEKKYTPELTNRQLVQGLSVDSLKTHLNIEMRRVEPKVDLLRKFNAEIERQVSELNERLARFEEQDVSACSFEPNVELLSGLGESGFGRCVSGAFSLVTCYSDGQIRVKDFESSKQRVLACAGGN